MSLRDAFDDPEFVEHLADGTTLLPDGFCDPTTYNSALKDVGGWTDAASAFLPRLPRFTPERLRFFRTRNGVVFPSPGGLSLQQLYRGLGSSGHALRITLEHPGDQPDLPRFPIQDIEPGWIAVTFASVDGATGHNAQGQEAVLRRERTCGRMASAAEVIAAAALYAALNGSLPRMPCRIRTRQDDRVTGRLAGTTWGLELYGNGISLTRVSTLEAAAGLTCLASYTP